MASGSSQRAPSQDLVTPNDDAFSPTDGYFNALPPVPQDEMIPNPEQENTPAAKEIEAREAEAEREAERAARARSWLDAGTSRRDHSIAASSVVSASSQRSVDTLLDDLEGRRPPRRSRLPTYDDAIAERPYVGPPLHSLSSPQNYSTMNPDTMSPEVIERSQLNVAANEPSETSPLIEHSSWSGGDDRRSNWLRRRWNSLRKRPRLLSKRILLVLLCGCIIASIIEAVSVVDRQKKDKSPKLMPIPPSDEPLKNADAFCPGWAFNRSQTYEFQSTNSLTFAQLGSSNHLLGFPLPNGTAIRKSGEIHVMSTDMTEAHASSNNIFIHFEVYVSHADIIRLVQSDIRDELVLISTPRTYQGDNACLYAVAYIMVPPNANITNFEIDSEFMSINLHQSLNLGTRSEVLDITSVQSKVVFPSSVAGISGIKSRDIRIHTEVGEVTGTYPLYDSLSIKSTAGSIDIEIDLKEIDPYDAKPATLSIQTASGMIRAIEPAVRQSLDKKPKIKQRKEEYQTPARDYRSSIQSLTGEVYAELVHGSQTEIVGSASSVNVTLAPYGDQERASVITAETLSTDLRLHLVEALPDPSVKIRNLNTTIVTQTGALHVYFPHTWEGNVTGHTITGLINLYWPHFVVEKSRDQFPFHYLSGHFGHGNSLFDFATISGETFLFGGNKTDDDKASYRIGMQD